MSKSNLKNQIQDLLNLAASDKNLTADALQQHAAALKDVTALEEERNNLVKENEELKETIYKKNILIDKGIQQCIDADNRLIDVEQREQKVAEREVSLALVKAEVEHNKQRVEDHKEMFTTVFRNSTVKENIYRSKNGSATDFSTSESTSKDITSE